MWDSYNSGLYYKSDMASVLAHGKTGFRWKLSLHWPVTASCYMGYAGWSSSLL